MKITQVTELVLSAVVALSVLSTTVKAVGCFVCTSRDGNNPECEDTFNNTGKFYHMNCWASRKGRDGLFPATECIKMMAQHGSETYIVRSCVVDNGGTNSESEIGRQSHCGWLSVINFNGERMHGCILSCNKDGCNGSQRQILGTFLLLLPISTLLWLYG